MNIQSRLSGHWTDDELIDHFYCGELKDDHLAKCPECTNRLSSMLEHRRKIEDVSSLKQEVDNGFLTSQRRTIYGRLAAEGGMSWIRFGLRRWASVAAVAAIFCGSAFFFEIKTRSGFQEAGPRQAASMSDSQLAVEVSQIADSYEPEPTQPLQALFAE